MHRMALLLTSCPCSRWQELTPAIQGQEPQAAICPPGVSVGLGTLGVQYMGVVGTQGGAISA